MKHINNILSNKFNSNNLKRQILFVSFAIISYILLFVLKEKDILLSAAPLAISAAVKAAAGTIGKAAAKQAFIGGAKGALDGYRNAGEDESKLGGALKGAASGAASAAASSAAGSTLKTAKDAYNAKKAADAAGGVKVPPKQVSNPKVPGTTPSEGAASDSLNGKPEGLTGDTTAAGQKANSESDTEKDKKASKKDRMSPEMAAGNDNDTELEEGSETLKKKPSMFGCFGIAFAFIFLFLFLPLIMTFIISPTTKTIKGFNCDNESKSVACELSTGFSNFFEKAKNLIAYGKFATNGNILVEKTNDIYDKYYKEYNVKIDIPLILSTLFADGVNYLDDIDETGNIDVNSKLRQRFNSIEDLAQLQFSTYEVTYLCILDEALNPSMQVLTKTLFEGTTKKPTSSCGKTNVGAKVYRYEYQVDNSDYYERLKENKDILAKIYGAEAVATESDLDLLIAKIKLQKNTFDVIYGEQEGVCDSAGNIPSAAMEDSTVLLQNPLKGSYNITSYFGFRGGDYSNHKGIDVVGEKTIYAAGSGIVTRANTESMGGNVIEITHTTSDGRKFKSIYGHLKTMLVSKGDTVVAGETVIGIMGSTGTAATGVHLHFQFQEVGTNGEETIYNPLTLFVGANNYAYQCVGTINTSDTCVSSGGSIAYISKKNNYNYNLIRAIFRAKGINETSETKNNIVFTNETINYINSMKISGTNEQKSALSNIDIIKKQIKYNDEWVSYDGSSTYDFVVRGYFIESYGKVDPSIYDYVKIGVGEIEGNKYSCLGYSSSKDMYTKWNESHHAQIEDAIKYFANCLNLKTELSDNDIDDDATLQTYATTIASKYFGDSNPYETNNSAKLIVFSYKDLVEKGESLETLLNDCTTSNSLTGFEGSKGGQCDMYVEKGICLSNIAKYDNDEYWGKFVKQAGTSLARIRLLASAHELWGYARYCNDPNNTTTSTGERCRLTGWFDAREFDPAWSTLVGPESGDVLGGLDCGGFITRAYTTYIRRYFFEDKYTAFANYKPNYVLHADGMCNADTEYTTHYAFGEGNLASYFSNHTLKPGDVLCDSAGTTRHVIMFIGWDDDNGNGVWNSNEMMYFMHTGDPSKGVEVYARALSNIDNYDKNLVYTSYFTLNDKVK